MTLQALTRSTPLYSLFAFPPGINAAAEQPGGYSPQDFGLEVDEAGLAGEMSAALPGRLTIQPLPDVDPEDFEAMFQWFAS